MKNILNIIKPVAELGDAAFAELSVQYCIDLDQYSVDVCQGLETLEAPSVAYALRSMDIPSRTAQIFCSSLYGLCDQPTVLNYTVPFPKPKPSKRTRPLPSREPSIQVVHISDLHVDHRYTVGASYNCSESICCRSPEITVSLNGSYPAGSFGEYYCDAPVSLETSQFDAIDRFVPNRAFTLATGDIVEGAEWQTTNQEIVYDVSFTYNLMSSLLGFVFPAIGNHDANPVNSFPPAGTHTKYSNTYDYNAHAALWAHWIGPAAAQQVANNFGSYTTKYGDTNLRIISINTMFWEGVNWWIYHTTMPRDPSSVFAFLVLSLQLAEDNNERVWVIGHIPPGRSDALYDYSAYFDEIVQHYEATIAAMFWGHTHRDQFEVSYIDYMNRTAANARAIGYIAPSLTPTSGNPNFRVYDIDPVTFGVRDYTVYYANLSSPTYQTEGPMWSKYYSAKAAYASQLSPPVTDEDAELTPAVWSDIIDLFMSNDTVFQEYYDRKQRGWEYVPCEGSCKTEEICQLGSAQSQYACLQPSPAARRRDLEKRVPFWSTAASHDECGKSTMRDVLATMVGQGTGTLKKRLSI